MEIRMAGGVFELGNPESRGGGGPKHWKSSWRRGLKNRAFRRGGEWCGFVPEITQFRE